MIDSSPFGSRRLAELVAADAPIIYGILQPGPVLDDGIPYVRPSEISENGDIRLPEVRRTSPEIAQRYRRATLRSNDLLITIVGTIGRIGVVPPPLDGANITQSSARIRPNADLVCSSYLKWTLRSPPLRRQYDRHRLGTGVPRLNIAHVRDLEIPLPPLPEQRRIADILDKADAIRRKRQEAVKLADQFLRSAFLEMFGDPVTNPKGWPTRTLRDCVADISSGWSARSDARQVRGDEWGVLKISAVTTGCFMPSEHKAVGQPPFEKEPVVPKRGDLLFSRANTRELVAATCLVDRQVDRLFLPDKLWSISTVGHLMNKEYLRYLLANHRFRGLLTRKATGTSGSMLNISQGKLLEMKAPVPPIALQEEFRSCVWGSYSVSSRMRRANERSGTLFDSLVQRAFRGEL